MDTPENLTDAILDARSLVAGSDELRLAAAQLAIALADRGGEDAEPVDALDDRIANWPRNIESYPEADLTESERRFLNAAQTVVGLQFLTAENTPKREVMAERARVAKGRSGIHRLRRKNG